MLMTTQTEYLDAYFGITKAIEMIAEAGFDALDYSMFHMSNDDCVLNGDDFKPYVLDIKETAEKNGLFFMQAHAPFSFPMQEGEEDAYIALATKRVLRAMEIASILEAPIIVVHPLQFLEYRKPGNRERLKEINAAYYKSLMPYADAFNVTVACENMWQYDERKHTIIDSVCADPAEFSEYVDMIGNPHFTACLDLGHCGLTGREAQDCIRAMGGGRIRALHIHDNNYIDDQHILPGYGNMQWDEILKALADIGYSGSFTFESDYFLRPYKNDPESALCALKLMASVGRTMIRKIEQI